MHRALLMQAIPSKSTATAAAMPATRASRARGAARAGAPWRSLARAICALLALSATALQAADAPARPAAPATQAAVPPATARPAKARVEGGYVRGLPPGQRVTSAYFALVNPDATPLRLIGASSPRAGRVELHAHEMRDGMARMRKREFVDVPARGSVRFAPGGLHLMLFDLQGTLVDREPVPITLRFDGGAQLQVTLPVCSVMRPSCP